MLDNTDSAGKYKPVALSKIKTLNQDRLIHSAAGTIREAAKAHSDRIKKLHKFGPDVSRGEEYRLRGSTKKPNSAKAVAQVNVLHELKLTNGIKQTSARDLHDRSGISKAKLSYRARNSNMASGTIDLPKTATAAEFRAAVRQGTQGHSVVARGSRRYEYAGKREALAVHDISLAKAEAERKTAAALEAKAAEKRKIAEAAKRDRLLKKQKADQLAKIAAERKLSDRQKAEAEKAAKKAKKNAHKATENAKTATEKAKKVESDFKEAAAEMLHKAQSTAKQTEEISAGVAPSKKMSKGKIAVIAGGLSAAGIIGRTLYNRHKAKKQS